MLNVSLVLWKINPLFATWMCSNNNVLFRKTVLAKNSIILELGCGASGLPGMAITPRVGQYIATDQKYVLKLFRQNLEDNLIQLRLPSQQKDSLSTKPCHSSAMPRGCMDFMELDWELSDATSLLASLPDRSGNMLSAVLSCDCIYNDTLIKPLVQTCEDLCNQQHDYDSLGGTFQGPICIVAQQLRSSEVFEEWLTEFNHRFHVWRLPDDLLTAELRLGSGYVIHVGMLRRFTA